jgi:hypothetical protein
MAARRRRGEDGISFEHRGPCRDPQRHRHCPGLWRGEVTLGYTEEGRRTRRKVSGKTKAAVVDKLRELHGELDKGIIPRTGYGNYTVRQAAEDWLANGLDGRSAKTIKKNQNVLEPILKAAGGRKLRELSAGDVRQALSGMATEYSSAAVVMGHLALKRAIRHAETNDLVSRNVATLVDTPKGREGRPSKSLTLEQAVAVITAAENLPVLELHPGLKDVRRPAALMYAYIVLSLLVEPAPTFPEARAEWHASFAAMVRVEGVDVRHLTDGQLFARRRAYETETSWAPKYVAEELRASRKQEQFSKVEATRHAYEATAAARYGKEEMAALHDKAADSWAALGQRATLVRDQLAEADDTAASGKP